MFKLFLDESATGGPAAAQPAEQKNEQGETLTFDGWLGKQDETVKGLLDGHTSGLKRALESERESRKDLEKQIKALAGSAQKEGELRTQLEHISAQFETLNKQVAFMEAAARENVSNPKALFVLAVSGDHFDKKGVANFAALRNEYPEFFIKPIPKGNAGAGAEAAPAATTMNDLIRRAAGRQGV